MVTHTLGRIVEHDERSRSFRAAQAGVIKSVQHTHYGDILDQGNLGSCTGNAIAQLLNTDPIATLIGHRFNEDDAVALYSLATVLDGYPGTYKPDDTGSSGLAAAKAAVQKGYIDAYLHAFGLNEVLAALTLHPVIIGIPWYDGMFTPDANNVISISGNVAGGHEIVLKGLDTVKQTVTILNSWGPNWGRNGEAEMTWATLDTLLKDNGDCTVPTKTAPIPVPTPTPTPDPVPVPDPTPTPVVDTSDADLAAIVNKWLKRNPWFYKYIQNALKKWLAAKGL